MTIEQQLKLDLQRHIDQVAHELAEFRATYAISFIVSISGGAEKDHAARAEGIVDELVYNLKDTPTAIMTGGTDDGVPLYGVQSARKYGLPTIGVFPEAKSKYAVLDMLDLAIGTLPPSIGDAGFGTETPSFVQLPDHAVYIGGGYGTLAEVSTMLKVNKSRADALRKQKPTPPLMDIIPIEGTQGTSDLIRMLVQLTPHLAYCLPEYAIQTGREAAEYIKEQQAKRSD